jgi:2-polyprenyl-3-methyl-5-hydroxy-6-metoxy-1,4-benzoquinol methylase
MATPQRSATAYSGAMLTDARPPDSANPFDEIADEYDAWYSTPLGSFVVAEEEAALLDAVADESGHLLDVGAGTGWWSRVLARRGFSVTALEPSAPMRLVGAARGAAVGVPVRGGQGSDAPAAAQGSDALGAARGSVAPAAAVGPIAWVAGTADRLPASDGAFDVVVLMTVLEFLPGPEQALI